MCGSLDVERLTTSSLERLSAGATVEQEIPAHPPGGLSISLPSSRSRSRASGDGDGGGRGLSSPGVTRPRLSCASAGGNVFFFFFVII